MTIRIDPFILRRHWDDRLFRYCFAVARGDGALAGEIVQATYLRVARHMRELPDEAALWNWLARAARSAATDLRRVRGRYRGALGRFGDWLRERGRTRHEAGDDGAEAALLGALDEALAALSDEQRLPRCRLEPSSSDGVRNWTGKGTSAQVGMMMNPSIAAAGCRAVLSSAEAVGCACWGLAGGPAHGFLPLQQTEVRGVRFRRLGLEPPRRVGLPHPRMLRGDPLRRRREGGVSIRAVRIDI